MASSSISSIRDLNAAIVDRNPFPNSAIVSDREIWGPQLPNLSSLNDHCIGVILQALERARTRKCLLTSIALTGESGSGKSHAIAQIRDRVQQDGNALFFYINAGHLTDLNLLRYQLHQRTIESLRQPGSSGVMQWQELAAAIANRALRSIDPGARSFSPTELLAKLNNNTLAKNQTWVDRLADAFFKLKPAIADPDLVRAILWTLCNTQAAYSTKWLSGMAISSTKASELGLPNRVSEHRDADAWEIFLQTLTLISDYYPCIICFDRLEASDKSEAGLKRERVVASLIKRIWDTLPRAGLHHGIAIVNVMSEETWTKKVQSLPSGIVAYLCKQGEPMHLSPIADDGIVELVSVWLKAFYGDRNLTPPTPVYPFEAGQLKALGRERLSIREILEWCAENFRPVEADPFESVEAAFEGELAAIDVATIWESNSAIADALSFAFHRAIGHCIAGVTIAEVSDRIQRDRANRGYIHFTVTGHEQDLETKIALCVVQDVNGKTVEAALKRLIQTDRFGFDRPCLIRSHEKAIPTHWQAYRHLYTLSAELGGTWVDLKPADIAPLLAIWRVDRGRFEYGVSEERLFEFIAHRKLVTDNPLIQAIARTCLAREAIDDLFEPQLPSLTAIDLAASPPS